MSKEEMILAGRICPYCGGTTILTDSSEVYGRSYGLIYLCRPCNAYVGVHKGTFFAKGRLANAELREWKKKAHYAFDPIWKEGYMTRSEAYEWLSVILEKPIERTHIGMFDVRECEIVMEMCQQFRNSLGV